MATNIVILDTQGKVWPINGDIGTGYFAILKHIVQDNHLTLYYGRRAKTLIIDGEIKCTDLGERALAYMEELNKELTAATMKVRTNHMPEWAW